MLKKAFIFFANISAFWGNKSCISPFIFAEKTLIFGTLVMFYSFHRTSIKMTQVQLQQLQKQL